MSTDYAGGGTYALGEPHPNTNPYATVETKPSYTLDDSGRVNSGGGYEHARSTEYRPHTPTRGKESVYASIHRLSAVAWCYSDEWSVRDILDDLRGQDVHHTTGVEWANVGESPNFDEPGLEVLGHGEHSEITQAQRRAWAEDTKREAEKAPPDPDAETCDGCGEDTTDALARSDEWDGEWCVSCVQAHRERQQALDELEDLEL